MISGPNGFSGVGRALAGAGDINGDGFDDYIIGAPDAYNGYANGYFGAAFVVYGTADGPATLNLSEIDGTNGFRISGAFARGDLEQPIGDGVYALPYAYDIGAFVAGIGDVNGDGIDDIAVAAPSRYGFFYYGDAPLERSNAIFVVFGRDDGGFGAEFALTDIDGTNGFQVIGTGGVLNGIEAAGDVNGDGVDDFLISQSPVPAGDYGYYGYPSFVASAIGTEDSGEAPAGYVIYGESGLGAGGALDIDDLDGTNGFAAIVPRSGFGGFSNDRLAFESFSTALGDIDGDGFDDVAVRTLSQSREEVQYYGDYGGLYTRTETVQVGRLHIVFGGAEPIGPEVNVYDAAYSGDERVVPIFSGAAYGLYYGYDSLFENTNVRGLGDINGDGFADFAVSQPNVNLSYEGGFSIGYVDVFLGGGDRSGFYDGPDIRIVKTDSTLDYLGFQIAGIGDVNGDGIDDFAISAPYTFFLETVADGVFIVFGVEPGAEPQVIDLDLIGEPGGDALGYRIFSSASDFFGDGFGTEIAAAGDVNGDGYADLLIGEPNADAPSAPNGGTQAGKTYLVHGGLDALEAADRADGSDDNVIDIANIGVNVETGIVPIVLSVRSAGQVGASLSEGDPGETTIFTFEVRRTGDLSQDVSFAFEVLPFGSTPANFADFVGGAFPSGVASFESGAASAFVEIAVQGDAATEASELFTFRISDATVGDPNIPISIDASDTLARIVNDDFPIRFFALDGSVFEGNPGDDRTLTFTVTRTGPGFAASVDFAIAGDSVFPADAADFEAGEFPRSGTLDFAAGEFSKTITLRVAEDFDIETSERVRLTLSNATSAESPVEISDAVAIGTLRNDDFAPELFVYGDTFLNEGGPGSGNSFSITFERRGDFDGPVEITYTLNPFPNAGDFLAADPGDLVGGLPQGPFTVTIPDGEAFVSIEIPVVGDFVIEPRESFSVDIVSVDRPEGGVIYDLLNAQFVATILNDDGRPPIIPPGVESDVFGDPHIVTLDGLGYDFQAVGEYILVETLPGAANPFQVQVRFEPLPGSDLVSVTTRMAVVVNGVTIEIDAIGPEPLLIDGVPPTAEDLALGAIDADGDGIADIFLDTDLGDYQIVLNGADEQLVVKPMDGAMTICVFLSEEAGGNAGAVRGLMGDGAGDGVADDIALRDGTALAQPLSFETLYGDYAASWRLDGTDGKAPLFSSTTTFPDDFPKGQLTLDDLPADLRAAAEAAALAAGLDPADTVIFEAAVLDFALTGDSKFFAGALGLVADPVDTLDPTGAPALPTVVGVTVADAAAFSEGDSGQQDAVFTFYRIGDASGELTVSYAIGGAVDAADLTAGTALTGTVTFLAGQSSVSLAVPVLGDLATEADEALKVSITGTDDAAALVAAPSATRVILTDDFAPVLVDDRFGATEDESVSGNLFAANPDAEDMDPDGDALSVVSVSSGGAVRAVNAGTGSTGLFILPSGAHLTVNADGSFTYLPFGFTTSETDTIFDALDAGEVAVETFSYTVLDGNGGLSTATATVTVTGINDAPIAIVDGATLSEDDASATLNALTGTISPDVDPEGGPLTVTNISIGGQSAAVDRVTGATLTLASGAVLTMAADGTATLFTNGAFEDLGDEPGQIVQRTLTFIYTIEDAGGLEDNGLIQFFVQGVNDAPETSPISASFAADAAALEVALLDGATDAEGDDLSAVSPVLTASDGRTVLFSLDPATGLLTLTPGQFGDLLVSETLTVEVSYSVSDGALETATLATITINGVGESNRPPVATDDSFSTEFGETLAVTTSAGLLFNDFDPDGDAITVVDFTGGTKGTVSDLLPDGSFVYTPNAGASGTETFSYTISDGFDVATATVTIEIGANGVPVAMDDSFSTEFGETLAVTASAGLLFNDFDPDGDAITVVGFTGGTKGTVSDLLPDGSFVYTPNAGASGTETFGYTISDGFDVATATVTIEIGREPVEPGDFVLVPNVEGRNVFIGADAAERFQLGDGEKDQLRFFDAASDVIDVSAWGVQSFAELSIADRGVDARGRMLVSIHDAASGNSAYHLGALEAAELTAESFVFAPVEDLIVSGQSPTSEKIIGRAGNDMIVGDGGFNAMFGQGGADAFVIGTGRGDQVMDFEDGVDLIDLTAWGVTSFAELAFGEREDVFTIRDEGGAPGANLVRIAKVDGLALADLDADDFIFADPLTA